MECIAVCPENAIRNKKFEFFTDPDRCMACGSCADACLAGACEMAGRELTVNWEDRYHAKVVQTGEHMVQCIIYMDLNHGSVDIQSGTDTGKSAIE